ncbi:MAG: sigma-70 family RNA polymerase sigma factor [Myxococcota bacterium]
MSTDDTTLYAHWSGGDRHAGEALVRRHLPGIARFFANKVLRRADRGDLTSRTFEICARSLGEFRDEGSFRSYLYGIARNVLRDYLKALQRKPDMTPLEDASLAELTRSPSMRMAEAESRQLLLLALRAIPLHAQIVVELSLFEELTRGEIAEILDVPEGTVASRLRRGKRDLERELQALSESEAQLENTLDSITAWRQRMRLMLDEAS